MERNATLHTRESTIQNKSTKSRIKTVVSPADGPIADRIMWSLTNINILRKKLCIKLVYLQDNLGTSALPHTCHISCTFHASLFYELNNIWHLDHITKFLIIESYALACYLAFLATFSLYLHVQNYGNPIVLYV